jgi:RNA polymerase sigma-70 factor (ECF subfamily)
VPFTGVHNEPVLLLQISQGDREAFRVFYQHYYPFVQQYIALFEPSGENLEELAQDVFVRIWEKRGHLARVESLKNYLFLITRNVVFNYLRSLRMQHKVKELDGLPEQAGDDLENELLFRQYYKIAQEAVEKLPPGRRKVLKMSIDDGKSLDEIAEELNISRAGVKKQLYAATAFVRQYLQEHGEMTVLLFVFLSLFEL